MGLRLAAAAVLATGLVGLSAASASAAEPPNAVPAVDAPGDNGDVKIHDVTTDAEDPRNEPKVCEFYLLGLNFDAGQQIRWIIVEGPPFKEDANIVLSGTLTLDDEGEGRTINYTLPDGHYKLYWNFVGENGFAKQKVFKVDCVPDVTPSASPSKSMSPLPSPSLSESASPSPSTSPSVSESASPSTSASPVVNRPPGGSLPLTGVALTAVLGSGLALLIAGVVTLFMVRRRSTSTEQPES
ncbi:MAG TPA: hypothetical protein VGR21_10185 [Cryptosporangiaceae bacterium]|nr:hypothetical protein [Cryptosporangiaceae bacterium]